jgi:CheY-like chemotaxis protein
MGLQLRFSDKYRLWAELIQSGVTRVFIESDQDGQIGSEVPVEVVLPELPLHIVLTGTIVGLRPKSDRFGRGVFVKFEPQEIDKCRSYLGLSRFEDRGETGRRVSRVDCALALRLLLPPNDETYVIKNMSERGLLAKCTLPLILGQRVKLQITLDNGQELILQAEVSWSRSELGLVGVRFVELPATTSTSIIQCINRIARVREMAPVLQPILIAEDDPGVLGYLVKVLTNRGYQVQTATRGDDAIAQIRKHRPKLVLLDVLMPGIDGKEICRRMRGDAEMVGIPVILMSALDRSTLHAIAQETGASDYLSKPVSISDLISTVGKYAQP